MGHSNSFPLLLKPDAAEGQLWNGCKIQKPFATDQMSNGVYGFW